MIAASISSIESKVFAEAALMGRADAASASLDEIDIIFRIGHFHDGISAAADLIDQCVAASLSYIKDVRLFDYIKLDKDVLWVTPDAWEQLMIMSNVDWVIT